MLLWFTRKMVPNFNFFVNFLESVLTLLAKSYYIPCQEKITTCESSFELKANNGIFSNLLL